MPISLVVALALAAGGADPVPVPPPPAEPRVSATLPAGGTDFQGAMLGWSGTLVQGRADTLAMPLRTTRLSSVFGLRRDPIRGTIRTHQGIDLPDRLGTPVHAAAGGVVVFAGPARGYGNLVRIDHGAGGETRYAHLGAIGVGVGDVLEQGAWIGTVGSTGRSTGAHLHFEVRVDGLALDPLARIDQPIGAVATDTAAPSRPHWDGYASGETALPQSRLR